MIGVKVHIRFPLLGGPAHAEIRHKRDKSYGEIMSPLFIIGHNKHLLSTHILPPVGKGDKGKEKRKIVRNDTEVNEEEI